MRSRVIALESAVLLSLAAGNLVLGRLLGAAILVGLALLAATCAWALWPIEKSR
jgi:hypothetical protein